MTDVVFSSIMFVSKCALQQSVTADRAAFEKLAPPGMIEGDCWRMYNKFSISMIWCIINSSCTVSKFNFGRFNQICTYSVYT